MRTMIFGAAALSLALIGCNSTAPLTPTQQAVVTIAYDSVCPVINSKALATQVATASQTTQGAYTAALSLCAKGAPTTAAEGGFDIAQAFVVLLPYLWLLLFFVVPFVIVLKISFSDVELAIPP